MSEAIINNTFSTTTRTFDEVTVGDALPELVVPLTRTLIVSTAMASPSAAAAAGRFAAVSIVPEPLLPAHRSIRRRTLNPAVVSKAPSS